MNYKSLIDSIAKIIEMNVSDINIDSPLEQYGNWDSLAAVSTIALIDQHYNVLLKACEIENCKTLRQVFDLVDAKQFSMAANS